MVTEQNAVNSMVWDREVLVVSGASPIAACSCVRLRPLSSRLSTGKRLLFLNQEKSGRCPSWSRHRAYSLTESAAPVFATWYASTIHAFDTGYS